MTNDYRRFLQCTTCGRFEECLWQEEEVEDVEVPCSKHVLDEELLEQIKPELTKEEFEFVFGKKKQG